MPQRPDKHLSSAHTHPHLHTPEERRLRSKNFHRLPSSSSPFLSPSLTVPPLSRSLSLFALWAGKLAQRALLLWTRPAAQLDLFGFIFQAAKESPEKRRKEKNSFDQWLKPITNIDSLTTVLSLPFSLCFAPPRNLPNSPRCRLSLWNWICHCFSGSCGICDVCVCVCVNEGLKKDRSVKMLKSLWRLGERHSKCPPVLRYTYCLSTGSPLFLYLFVFV